METLLPHCGYASTPTVATFNNEKERARLTTKAENPLVKCISIYCHSLFIIGDI